MVIDDDVKSFAEEMSYRLAESLAALIRATCDGAGKMGEECYTPALPFIQEFENSAAMNGLTSSTVAYYDKAFIANLRANTPFASI